jgi:hypothetical protein
MLGSPGAADILSLIKGGSEVSSFGYAFQQGIDSKGRATTRVYSGTLHVTLSQLPSKQMIEWALNSRKYSDGVIVMLDAENIPLEKVIFQNATCVSFEINYTETGKRYTTTKLIIQVENLIVGDGITFSNEWTN